MFLGRTLPFVGSMVIAAMSVFGQDHCSLLVKVTNPQGIGIYDWVTVTETDGRSLRKEHRPGGVRFCDLGILPVTVTVGHEFCNQVVVRNVFLAWGETTTVWVVRDREPCLADLPPSPRGECQMLFRFRDSEERELAGGTLKIENPTTMLLKADRFGRVLVPVGDGTTIVGTVKAKGYPPVQVNVTCTTENRLRELPIVLEKVSP